MGWPRQGKHRVAVSVVAVGLLAIAWFATGRTVTTPMRDDARRGDPIHARGHESGRTDLRTTPPGAGPERRSDEAATGRVASRGHDADAARPVGTTNDERRASLDHASARVIAARLAEAIDTARVERGVPIAEGLIDRVIDDGAVRILVAQTGERPDLAPRLRGTRHEAPEPFHYVPFVAVEVGPEALLQLVESPDVLGIERDRRHRPSLLETIPLISADAATAAGFDGSGRVIVVLDTGIDTTHPAFAGRLVDEACFSRDGNCPGGGTREFGPGTGAPCNFGCGHGTLVAGAALSLDAVGGRNGVAPDARFISIQVYSNDGGTARAWTSDIIAGLEHAYALRAFHPIAAVNMSLGGDLYSTAAACDAANTARKAAIDLLRGAGIASIAASGNEGDTNQISEPACISTAVSVGATTKGDVVAGFSDSADFLSLLAPGSLVQTTRLGGGFVTASGTSLAAPHVAGAWAAILEAVPGSNVAEVLFALQSTGVPIDDGRNGVTTSRIDVANAITALDAGIDIPDPVGNPGAGGPGGAPGTGDPSSACGLVGLEVLSAWGLATALRRRSHQPSGVGSPPA